MNTSKPFLKRLFSVVALLILSSLVASAAPGDVDTTFGTGGKVLTPMGSGDDLANCMALQNDGKVLVAGDAYGNPAYFAIVRYSAGGGLDTSFGSGGKVLGNYSASNSINAMAVQSDGKILAGGYVYTNSKLMFGMARYLSNGSLDTSFGSSGWVLTDFGVQYGSIYGIAVQPDGKIVAAGRAWNGADNQCAVVRYLANGSLDSGFGSGGQVISSFGLKSFECADVAVLGTGKLIVGGSGNNASSTGFAAGRLNADGTIDSSFGTAGLAFAFVQPGVPHYGRSMAVRPDGTYVIAGSSHNGTDYDFAAIRFLANGTVDSGFGTAGHVLTSLGSFIHDQGYKAMIQGDGKLIVAGKTTNASDDFALVRYTSAGVLDSTFGTSGKVVTSLSTGSEFATGAALQSDGKIVVTGYVTNGSNTDFAAIRYLGDVVIPPAKIGVKVGPLATDPSITDSQATPISLGSTELGTPSSRSFTIVNSGGQTLNVTSITAPTGFSVLNAPSSVIAGGSATFQVRLTATGTGTFSGSVLIANDDATANPFHLPVTGVVTGNAALPEIVVYDGPNTAGAQILDGQASVLAFGTTTRGSPVTRSITIGNAGGQALAISGITAPVGFTVLSAPASVPASGSVTFQVRLDATAASSYSGNVVINNNDANEASFDFPLNGNVFVPLSGSLDATFGTGGYTTTSFGSNGQHYGRAVAVQTDGKIVLAGSAFTGTADDFAIVRYNVDGSLDSSFGSSGKVTTPIGIDYDQATCVAIQTDGKILAGGTSSNGVNYDFALARYNTNGTLDSAFGSGGKVTVAVGSGYDGAQSIIVLADGKIVLGGYASNGSNNDLALLKFTSTGALDTAFGSAGIVMTDFGGTQDSVNAMLLQSDGKIVAAGSTGTGLTNQFALARYNSNGSLDSSFGTAGKVTTAFGSSSDIAYAAILQGDGKIVVAGSAFVSGSDDFALARYLANGMLDTSFGSSGKVTTTIGGTSDSAHAVALDGTGRIVAAGPTSSGSSNDDFAVVRYLSNGTLDSSFGTGGKVVTAISVHHDDPECITLLSDGKILVGGWSSNGNNNVLALARYYGGTVVPPSIVMHDGVGLGSPLIGNAQAQSVAFATTARGQTVTRSFTVENAGDQVLSIGSIVVPSGFTVLSAPPSIPAPGSATFQIRFNSSSNGSFTGVVQCPSNDPDDSPFTFSITATALDPGYHQWATSHSLAEATIAPLSQPAGDGVSKLSKYAFNMNVGAPDVTILSPGTGIAGLPSIQIQGSGANAALRIEFVRRVGSTLVYMPQKSANLTSWQATTAAATITTIDAIWQRVVISEPCDATATPAMFGRVQLALP